MKTRTIICIAGLLMAADCSKTEFEVEKVPTWQLTMTGGAPDTKTSIGVPDYEGNVPFLWKAGDKVGIYVSAGANLTANANVYALIQEDEGQDAGPGYGIGNFVATLSGLETNTAYSVKLYYPYTSSAGTDGGTVSHVIPAVQTQQGGGISEHIGLSGGFAYGSAAFSTPADLEGYSPKLVFSLTHKTAIIWLNMKAADAGLNEWKVRSVIIAAPAGTNLCGNTEFNFSSGAFSIASGGANAVTVNIPGGASLATGSSVAAYAVVFPASVDGKQLTFTYTLESPDASQTKVVTHTRSIPEGLGAFEAASVNRFTESIPSADAGGWVYGPSRIDLSAGGTSNCYIVSTPGNYSFNATVIGNGQGGIITDDPKTTFHTASATIAPVSASLLWQTAPGLVTSVDLSDGKLTFTKPDGTEGNAVVCVKDGEGKILWSWHIWCTDTPEVQKYVTFNETTKTYGSLVALTGTSGNCYMMMDRHLGATAAFSTTPSTNADKIAAYGLLYQWGRKDPFIGANCLNTTDKTFATMYDADGNVMDRPAAVTPGDSRSIAYSIENPTLFIGQSQWFNTSSSVGNGGSLWGNNTIIDNTSVISTPRKTIYDPCPPGYMVPVFDVFSAMKKSSKTTGGVLFNVSNGAFKNWWPRTGNIGATTGALNGYVSSIGYVWSNQHASGNVNPGTYSRIGPGTTNDVDYTPSSASSSMGASVRCMQVF